jgi:ketosteroid isomerase-like protein
VGGNVERTAAAFEAFNRRDFDALVAMCHPDVEWTPPEELPGSRTYRGPDGVLEAVRDMITIFPDLQAEPVRFIEQGNRVAGLYLWHGRGGESGASVDAIKASGAVDFEDGLIRVARFWTDWETALAAVEESARPGSGG